MTEEMLLGRSGNGWDHWRSAQLECRKCHWKGRFDEGNIEYFQELMDCSYPLCSFDDTPVLAIVNYPTIEEIRASGVEIARISSVEAFQRTFHSTKLRRTEQLPDADAASFKLFWDFIESDGSSVTVIRLGERLIFQEPALWEGYERFGEVCEILREKYGSCITDLEPTSASELYLYGDSIRRRITSALFARESLSEIECGSSLGATLPMSIYEKPVRLLFRDMMWGEIWSRK